jgi:hypothetical protein
MLIIHRLINSKYEQPIVREGKVIRATIVFWNISIALGFRLFDKCYGALDIIREAAHPPSQSGTPIPLHSCSAFTEECWYTSTPTPLQLLPLDPEYSRESWLSDHFSTTPAPSIAGWFSEKMLSTRWAGRWTWSLQVRCPLQASKCRMWV